MLPNLLLASFAKWSTEAENNEPGFPTCPNLTSTEFIGYNKTEAEGEVILILKEGKLIEKLDKNDVGDVIFDKTVFYAESGGQVGDRGVIRAENASFAVTDSIKNG